MLRSLMRLSLIIILASNHLICKASAECEMERDKSCLNPGINLKACMCRCLDVQRYNGNYLKVHTNYRCTNSLKQCNQSLSFKYSVIDSSDENEEEVYISTRINVPYNKEIIEKIQEIQLGISYDIYIKTFCYICGNDCREILIKLPGFTSLKGSKEKTQEKMSSKYVILPIAISFLGMLILLTAGIVVVIVINARGRRQFHRPHVNSNHL